VRTEDAGQPHPAARQFLEDERERRRIDLAAAVGVGNIEPEQSERLHRLDQRMRVLVAVLHRRRDRHHVALHELADGLRDELLLVVEG